AYSLESGAPLPRTVGTVLAERILDVATIFVLLIAAFLLLYAKAEDRPSTTFLIVGAGLLVAALLALVVLHFLRERVNRHLPERVQRVYHSFREGTLSSFRQLPLVALLGLLGWLAEVGRLYLVVQSTGLEVGIGLIVFVTIANAILSAVPITPGGLGIVEPGIAGLLALTLVGEDALSVVLLDRSISYVSLLIFGSVAFLLHQRARAARNKVLASLAQADDRQPEAT
ncbi:MAG: lysylphosphatidylglycerol synthase transmembrane domain-containing protein, partial [Chloroflexi bacterium]|nr:lysylphosphatidylglycerol synthase transmembrane domain-containing protein [Chloroflexota bacterium]